MNDLELRWIFNAEAVAEHLSTVVRKGTRVLGDMVLVMQYINKKILRSTKSHPEYFTLNNKDMIKMLGLTEPQIRNAKNKLREFGFMEALPPRFLKAEKIWLNIWRIMVPQGLSIKMLVNTKMPWLPAKPAGEIMYEENVTAELETEFLVWLTAVADEEIAATEALAEWIDYDLAFSNDVTADMAEIAYQELSNMISNPKIVELRSQYDEMNSKTHTYDVDCIEDLDAIMASLR